MPANKDFSLRVETIDECLRNQYRKWTLDSLTKAVNEKLADRYGKSAAKRTIQEDLRYMREEKNAPIKKTRENGQNFFSYSDPAYSTKNIPVDAEEIDLLQDAISILKQVNNFKITDQVQAIIDKLQNTVSTNVVGQPCFIQFEKHTVAAGTSFIDTLFSAIKARCALRITYKSFNAVTAQEHVYHPYLLKEYRNRWFLLCRKGDDMKITILALDRIKDIRNSAEEFIQNNLFQPENHFNYLIGVSVPERPEPEKIIIKVSKVQAPYLLTKPIHYTQEVLQQINTGELLISIYLACNFELKAALLSYGPEIEILEPMSLRMDLKKLFDVGANLYAKQPSELVKYGS